MGEQETPKVEVERIGRRRFLEVSALATSGVMGVTLLGVGGRFFVGDALKAQNAQWVQLGEVAAFPQGEIHKATYQLRHKDAWRTTDSTGLIYLFSEDGTTYSALSAVCTHLGCNVHIHEEGGFRCPCHDAYFAPDGEVVSGPPRRSLVRLETKIEAGIVSVLI